MNEHYKAVLADLKQMKADAEAGIRAIERLMQRSGATKPPESKTPVSEEEGLFSEPDEIPGQAEEEGESVQTRVLNFINEHPGQTLRPPAIMVGIGEKTLKPVHRALSNLVSEKKISRTGRAKYRAKNRDVVDATASAVN